MYRESAEMLWAQRRRVRGGRQSLPETSACRHQVRVEEDQREAPPWVAQFLAGLMVTGSVRSALAEVGIAFETAWALRLEEPAFARYWDRAVRVHKAVDAGLPFFEAAAAAGAVH